MASNWAASALDWWQEAGVDVIVGETPREWLSPKAKTAPTVIKVSGSVGAVPQIFAMICIATLFSGPRTRR